MSSDGWLKTGDLLAYLPADGERAVGICLGLDYDGIFDMERMKVLWFDDYCHTTEDPRSTIEEHRIRVISPGSSVG